MPALRISRTFTSGHPTHLPPFPMWAAFPSSEYYGGSVPLGLSPGRGSRVPRVADVQVAVGALFVPLRSLETTPFPRVCPGRTSFAPGGGSPALNHGSRSVSFTGWTLGFKRFSFHLGNRVSAGLLSYAVSLLPAFANMLLSPPAFALRWVR